MIMVITEMADMNTISYKRICYCILSYKSMEIKQIGRLNNQALSPIKSQLYKHVNQRKSYRPINATFTLIILPSYYNAQADTTVTVPIVVPRYIRAYELIFRSTCISSHVQVPTVTDLLSNPCMCTTVVWSHFCYLLDYVTLGRISKCGNLKK